MRFTSEAPEPQILAQSICRHIHPLAGVELAVLDRQPIRRARTGSETVDFGRPATLSGQGGTEMASERDRDVAVERLFADDFLDSFASLVHSRRRLHEVVAVPQSRPRSPTVSIPAPLAMSMAVATCPNSTSGSALTKMTRS